MLDLHLRAGSMSADEKKEVKSLPADDVAPPALDEPEFDEPILNDLSRLLDNRKLADVVFVVGKEKESIYAHKVCVCASASHLLTLFAVHFGGCKRHLGSNGVSKPCAAELCNRQ